LNEDAGTILEFSRRRSRRPIEYELVRRRAQVERNIVLVDNPRRGSENEKAYTLTGGTFVPYVPVNKVVWLTDEAHEVTEFMTAPQESALFEKKSVNYKETK
jgi:hypothetical protein